MLIRAEQVPIQHLLANKLADIVGVPPCWAALPGLEPSTLNSGIVTPAGKLASKDKFSRPVYHATAISDRLTYKCKLASTNGPMSIVLWLSADNFFLSNNGRYLSSWQYPSNNWFEVSRHQADVIKFVVYGSTIMTAMRSIFDSTISDGDCFLVINWSGSAGASNVDMYYMNSNTLLVNYSNTDGASLNAGISNNITIGNIGNGGTALDRGTGGKYYLAAIFPSMLDTEQRQRLFDNRYDFARASEDVFFDFPSGAIGDLILANAIGQSSSDPIALDQTHATIAENGIGPASADVLAATQYQNILSSDSFGSASSDAVALSQTHDAQFLAANGQSSAQSWSALQLQSLILSGGIAQAVADAISASLGSVHNLLFAGAIGTGQAGDIPVLQAHNAQSISAIAPSSAVALLLSQTHPLALLDSQAPGAADLIIISQDQTFNSVLANAYGAANLDSVAVDQTQSLQLLNADAVARAEALMLVQSQLLDFAGAISAGSADLLVISQEATITLMLAEARAGANAEAIAIDNTIALQLSGPMAEAVADAIGLVQTHPLVLTGANAQAVADAIATYALGLGVITSPSVKSVSTRYSVHPVH